MKLTEAIQFNQPLFESYDVLRNKIEKAMNESPPSRTSLAKMQAQISSLDKVMAEILSYIDVSTPKGLSQLARMVFQHPVINIDVSSVIREMNRDSQPIDFLISTINDSIQIILDNKNNPRKQDVDMREFASGNGYDIYEINNYSAARSICNKFDTSHCIGSSNTRMFNKYADNIGQTYAIIFDKQYLFFLHYSMSSFLITDHENYNILSDNDFPVRKKYNDFSRIMFSYGLDEDQILDAFGQIMTSREIDYLEIALLGKGEEKDTGPSDNFLNMLNDPEFDELFGSD